MPKITIDDIELEVEDGLNLIQAATRLGIDIPHFCYHPSLSIVAQCRQCLVEVEGVPKVLPACNTFVRDGLVVKTKTEKALKAREATVEFTLINHPLDCPICDKGGECPLQLTTFKHGPGYSRFDGPEEKKVRRKYYLNDRIIYDPNRCIMCTRCVRFTDEVTKTGELGTSGRGFRKKIVVFPGKELDNELSGNVIDLCPVGALLNKDNLHEERVWYWKFTDSVCSLCSTGCNITVGVDPRVGKAKRIRPRINGEVNDHWICDTGRHGFKHVQETKRLRDPILAKRNGHQIVSWEEASESFYNNLTTIGLSDYKKIAFITSGKLTNEELYLLSMLKDFADADHFVSDRSIQSAEKKFGLISTDVYPNGAGVNISGISTDISGITELLMQNKIDAVFISSLDLFEITGVEKKNRLEKALSELSYLAVMDHKLTQTARYANLILPGSTPYEKDGTYTNDQGRVQRLRKAIDAPGNSRADWEILSLLCSKFDESVKYSNPEEIFRDIAGNIPAYRGLNYDIIGMLGANIKH